MGLMDGIKKAVDNVADAVSEAGHKSAAEGERVKRETAGDVMTPGEHVSSVLNEGKEEVLGGIDHAKRDIRSNT